MKLEKVLDSIQKMIISSMYVGQLKGDSPLEIIKEKSMLDTNEINSKISKLIDDKIVNEDKNTLTEKGLKSLSIVLAGGVFDIIHPGHIYTLNAAKSTRRYFGGSGSN